jgi:hypothetical protein
LILAGNLLGVLFDAEDGGSMFPKISVDAYGTIHCYIPEENRREEKTM